MLSIEPYRPADLPQIVAFAAVIQEYERVSVPDLRRGDEIGPAYARFLLSNVAEQNGVMLLARARSEIIGFVCAWIAVDDDMLVREEARAHGYVSDIFVAAPWRRHGVAHALLGTVEMNMRERGCHRLRIASKAGNLAAMACYEAAGFRPYEVVFNKALE